jgi:putative thioredoxin
MPGTWVIEATDRDFETAVLERSAQVPVVVDFWAPWCGPCRTLGPLLERLAAEQDGGFVLAKVNVDENPALAQAFGVQSIPMVLAVRNAEVVDHFVGALPEAGLRSFLARLLPSEADGIVVEGSEKLAQGDAAGAEGSFRAALHLDPRHGGALIGLASVFAAAQRDDEALEVLTHVDPGPHRADADRLAAEIRVRQNGGLDVEGLRRQVEENPGDLEARFALAQEYGAAGRHEEALRTYLEIVAKDRTFRDDGARKAMLDLFALLGSEDPLTDRYRSELGKVLFR